MIEIEIDCNSDVIRLYDNDIVIEEKDIAYPNKLIDILTIIINKIGVANNLKITKIDEDNKVTIEEW